MLHGAHTTTPTQQSTNIDLIYAAARRTVPSRTSSEVAAISLGMKRALNIIPPSWRRRVLILTDSEFALDFYCGRPFNADDIDPKTPRVTNNRQKKRRKGTVSSARGRRQVTQNMELREKAHRRTLLSLLKETPSGILFAKVRSSSRGVGVDNKNFEAPEENDAADVSWNGIGFVDHDAADYLSSITRSFVNAHDDDGVNAHDDDGMNINISANGVEEELPFTVAKPLDQEDITWLENSDQSEEKISDFWQTIQVVGKEARHDRQKRNQRRMKIIQELLGSLKTQ
jgi:hypothetical protein